MMIAMSSYKDTLKRIGKYIGYVLIFICCSVITGVVAGTTWYVLTEHSYKECDNQFIYGCMSAGLSEEVCKGRVY